MPGPKKSRRAIFLQHRSIPLPTARAMQRPAALRVTVAHVSRLSPHSPGLFTLLAVGIAVFHLRL
jgi:hypothetical protein